MQELDEETEKMYRRHTLMTRALNRYRLYQRQNTSYLELYRAFIDAFESLEEPNQQELDWLYQLYTRSGVKARGILARKQFVEAFQQLRDANFANLIESLQNLTVGER